MPEVSVRLKDIDEDNWMDIVLLTTTDDPNPKVLEEYVASNALSICQAIYEGTWVYKGVYCGRKAVGFVMYGYSKERQGFELLRLMIDHNHQGKGFGSMALWLCLEDMFSAPSCDSVFLQVHRDNQKARDIYLKNGFRATGEMNGDEELFILDRQHFITSSKRSGCQP